MAGATPKLVLDGTEGMEGRALLLVSALHRRAARFAGVALTMIGDDPAVLAAIAVLRGDTGLHVALHDDPRAALRGASLFAAVAFRDTAHLPLHALHASGVRSLIAIQFPDLTRHGPATLALQRAAHDPDRLGDAIAAALPPR